MLQASNLIPLDARYRLQPYTLNSQHLHILHAAMLYRIWGLGFKQTRNHLQHACRLLMDVGFIDKKQGVAHYPVALHFGHATQNQRQPGFLKLLDREPLVCGKRQQVMVHMRVSAWEHSKRISVTESRNAGSWRREWQAAHPTRSTCQPPNHPTTQQPNNPMCC